jgi:PAS domain S-box-containing protein
MPDMASDRGTPVRYTSSDAAPPGELSPATVPSDAEVKLRGILALSTDAVISVDDQYRITLFNTAAERIFGYDRAEVLGQPLDRLLPETSRARHDEHLDAFRNGPIESRRMGERGQIWGRRRSGELFPAEASISKIRLGDVVHFTAVLRDVTEQRRAELEREALLHRETAARQAAEIAERRVAFLANASELLHSSLDYEVTFASLLRLIVPELALFAAIDVVEESGRIRRLHVAHGNPAMQALADELRAYPRDQTRYLTRHSIVSGQAELTDQVTDELLAAAAEDEEHFRILRALAPASYMTVPLRARDEVLGALLLARDAHGVPYDDADLQLASELARRAAAALDNARLYARAQRAVRARDDVLGVVSHDLRSPLSVISMCASSVLADEAVDPDRTRDAMHTVRQSLEWAQRLIRDLLDVTAIEAGGLSLTRRLEDPVLLVSRELHLLQALADERSVTMRADLPERLPSVHVDADRIMQALGNLIGNALKFTPSGSTIRVGAAEVAGGVNFFVSDAGPGVPQEDLARVFDRFWTARRTSRTRGTGMGLAIVRGIAEAHGGRAWVEPNPGQGATFYLFIPTSTESPLSDI